MKLSLSLRALAQDKAWQSITKMDSRNTAHLLPQTLWITKEAALCHAVQAMLPMTEKRGKSKSGF
ncbi:hypothetical protein [Helicobacter canis]|uniref:hypothetical protein n=1 Tax=Helicobacter canis TaxID=29419 RepID=UPI000E0F0CCF|nr:hypothetical protein [Helicobacter canis]